MKTFGNEGLEFIDQDILEKQKTVLSYLLKKIGNNLITGKSVINVSLPIYIFDARSLLDTFAYDYRLAPHFLDKAATCTDNLERLKLVTSYYITLFHLSLALAKPFNPILGETFQAKIGNSSIYFEQTSHHPPIANYYVKNPNYITHGYIELDVTAGPNTVITENKGTRIVKFTDGTTYSIKMPKFQMTGLTIGSRYLNFYENLIVEDLVNI
jgi:hypothetical protein